MIHRETSGILSYESIFSSILHYSDALNSKFSSSSQSLFANEGDDTFDFGMWQPSPDMPDIDVQTDEWQLPKVNTTLKAHAPLKPENIPEPQTPVDPQNSVSKPVVPVDAQASFKQVLPCWTRTRMRNLLGSNQLCPRVAPSLIHIVHIVHILSSTPLLLLIGATVNPWRIISILILVFPHWIMSCCALMMLYSWTKSARLLRTQFIKSNTKPAMHQGFCVPFN